MIIDEVDGKEDVRLSVENMKKMTRQEFRDNSLEMLKFVDTFCENHNIQYMLYAGTLLGCIRHKGFIPWDDDVDICMIRSEYERFERLFEETERYELQSLRTVKGYRLPYAKIRDKRTLKIDKITNSPYYPEQGLDIDIFIIDGYANNELVRKVHFKIQNRLFTLYQISLEASSSGLLKSLLLKLFRITFNPNIMAKIVNWHAGFWKTENTEFSGCTVGLYRHKMDVCRSTSHLMTKRYYFEGLNLKCPCDPHDVLTSLYGKTYMTPPPEKDRESTHTCFIVWKNCENGDYENYLG